MRMTRMWQRVMNHIVSGWRHWIIVLRVLSITPKLLYQALCKNKNKIVKKKKFAPKTKINTFFRTVYYSPGVPESLTARFAWITGFSYCVRRFT